MRRHRTTATTAHECDGRNRLAGLWSDMEQTRGRIDGLNHVIAQSEWNRYNSAFNRLVRMVEDKEDSLVAVNLEILHARGCGQAIAYMDQTLRGCGVSERKIAQVDSAIISVSPQVRSESDRKISREMASLDFDAQGDPGIFDGIRSKARQKAKARQDSIAAIETARLALLEKARQDSLHSPAVRRAEKKLKKQRDKAQQQILAIYDLVEADKVIKAQALFDKQRSFIRQYTDAGRFQMLQAAIEDAYDVYLSIKKKPRPSAGLPPETPGATMMLTSVKEENIDQLQKKVEEANALLIAVYDLLEKERLREADSVFRRERVFLKNFVLGEAYDMLEMTIGQSAGNPEQTYASHTYASTAQRAASAPPAVQQVAENKEKAGMYSMRIYSLIEEGRVQEAYDIFQKNRGPLQKYLDAEVFAMLETTVVQSWDVRQGKQ